MQTITVQVRTVYGRETIYPACTVSVLLARLAGTTTITPEAMRTIQALGYSVAVEAPAYSFADRQG
jgi:hypothetical protein